MEASALLSTGSSTTQTTSGRDLGGISGEDFMNILLKQLEYQDPFEPMSNQEMADQIATIRELEVNTQLGSKLAEITDQQRVGSAAVLIGKYVKGALSDEQGNTYTLEGIVTGVSFTSDGEVLLELDTGETLPLSNLEQVTEPQAEA